MRRVVSLAGFALVASLILVPAAAAQDQYEEPIEERVEEQIQEEVGAPVEVEIPEASEEQLEQIEQKTGEPIQADVGEPIEEAIRQKAQQAGEPVEVTVGELPPPQMIQKEKAKEVPKTGGPALGSLLLPGAVLLVGSGVLAFAVLRRK